MTSNEFIHHFVSAYLDGKGHDRPAIPGFDQLENRWLALHGLGKLEIFQYLYNHCRSEADFHQWLLQTKGAETVAAAASQFDSLATGVPDLPAAETFPSLLSPLQRKHWEEHGYLKIGGLVPEDYCARVRQFICDHQGIDLHDPATWYPGHKDWHGLMLQVYQQPDMEAIRRHPAIKQLFAELYGTTQLVPNTDKVSYNPPETAQWRFQHHRLHWDIDHSRPLDYYIQGLIYLDDTPEDRGPLRLIPGFHHLYLPYQQQFNDPVAAQQAIARSQEAVPVPGRLGDVVVWQHTLPHAASANHSGKPRFVQYLSFTRMD